MLCQFSFSNFRSYRDETTFDFQAAALSEFKDSLIKTEKGNDTVRMAEASPTFLPLWDA